MTKIQFHIEGGAGKNQDIEMRRAFRKFFRELDGVAKAQRSSLKLTLHGSRGEAYSKFCQALKLEPEAYHVLLVDSESPVKHRGQCWRHLRETDGWKRPEGTEEAQCQLMAQALEAWLFADRETLENYYGAGFQLSSLPMRRDVEDIPKSEHLSALKEATRQTTKGTYDKTKYLPGLLRRLTPQKVRERAWHCDRIFVTLSETLGAKITLAQSD